SRSKSTCRPPCKRAVTARNQRRAVTMKPQPHAAGRRRPAAATRKATPMETQPINVKSIRPCPTNPRKHFPQQMLEDLAASLKLHGMLVPLIVREIKAGTNGHAGDKKAAGKPSWELVDGECRWRAAELAGLLVVPCEVRDLTDAQVLEIQLTTFLQRSDIGDLEKAEAIQRMLEEEKLTLEDAAAKIGKSVSTLRGLLGLTRCSPAMREALSKGEVVSAVAQLV